MIEAIITTPVASPALRSKHCGSGFSATCCRTTPTPWRPTSAQQWPPATTPRRIGSLAFSRTVSRPQSKQTSAPPRTTKKFGVEPALIPDYLALVGDTADGYPGIDGIGAVTAAQLLNRYGPIEGFPPNVLGQRRDRALLFKDLATLRTDAPLFDDVDELEHEQARNQRRQEVEQQQEVEQLAVELRQVGALGPQGPEWRAPARALLRWRGRSAALRSARVPGAASFREGALCPPAWSAARGV